MARSKKPNQNLLVEDRFKYHHIKGDLIDLWLEKKVWIAVPTNGSINKEGLAVMGRGVAKLVADEEPEIRKYLGRRLRIYGNLVQVFPPLNLITVPVKHEWDQQASLELIGRSLAELNGVVDHSMKHYGGRINHVYCPRFGCGNGGLEFADVEPLIVKYLGNDSRFTLVSLPEEYEEHYGTIRKTERGGATGRGDGNAFCKSVPPSEDREERSGSRKRGNTR